VTGVAVRPVVLAIETATGDTEVALADGLGALGEVAVRRGRRHVESLHPAIERLCADAGVTLAELSVIGVDIGPGLFTGLRVGVTTAKTLALVLGIPLVAVTSLDILQAAARPLAGRRTVVVPVVDMRRGELAWQLGGVTTVGRPAQLGEELTALGGEVLLVGEGAGAYAGAYEVPSHVQVVAGSLSAPPAGVLGRIALERVGAGETVDPLACVPLYLREADAAINWESRPQRPSAEQAAARAGAGA
jgi:tRNA threonylcarbamoyladenosine biosynthesis protein TsaB